MEYGSQSGNTWGSRSIWFRLPALELQLSGLSAAQRAALVAKRTRAFIYYISRTGVTGAQDHLPDGLRQDVARLRLATNRPVAVGFGVSRPEHLTALEGAADAVVVGSALVTEVAAAPDRNAAVAAARQFVRRLRPTPR